MDTDADVIVIGGGPAGMMAAGRAAEAGAKVLLVEKNDTLGKKLRITGGGRCNMTNAEEDTRALLAKFKDAGKFLFSPFSIFDNKKALEFFHALGVETKVENAGRVFPATDSAETVWNALIEYMRAGGVSIMSNAEARGFDHEGGRITGVRLKGGRTLRALSYILATGGMSRPETGSTGDGFRMLLEIGHEVEEPSVSLVPVAVEDEWVRSLPGVSADNVKLRLFQNNMKQSEARGRILFTHFGLSGPTVLNMSRDAGELLKYGEVEISLDLLPDEDFSTLNGKLQELFKVEHRKQFKNSLSSLIPSALAPVVVGMSGIEPEKPAHSITREERIALMKLLKDVRMKVSGLLGIDKAVITSGGAVLEEVDTKTFSSKLFHNLYLVGDILNIDRPTGGYGLQLCWTSGYVAGTSAAH